MTMNQPVYLIEGPIGADTIAAEATSRGTDTGNGAYALFVGQVRADRNENSVVEAIEYSAYPQMVETVMVKLQDELFARYPFLTGLRVLHSTGLVRAGEVSLLVVVAGRHRTQIFEALSTCVELIKERLPVWKKELMADGSFRWIE
jgi:molybdopterin synthase catalytic subunit